MTATSARVKQSAREELERSPECDTAEDEDDAGEGEGVAETGSIKAFLPCFSSTRTLETAAACSLLPRAKGNMLCLGVGARARGGTRKRFSDFFLSKEDEEVSEKK